MTSWLLAIVGPYACSITELWKNFENLGRYLMNICTVARVAKHGLN